MRSLSRSGFAALFISTPLVIAGCAEAQLGAHVAKSIGATGQTGGGIYKVGDPYQIDGQWYYPQEDETYDREGIASWYGPNFHGKPTANGEVFDQNLITAAHPTLPMPIYARVTNLENGRSLVVRINDRGPFVADREIDLSRRSAELLGYRQQGTARVRVQYLRRAPLEGDVADVQAVTGAADSFVMPPAAQENNENPAIAAPTEPVRVAALGGAGAVAAAAPVALQSSGTLTASDRVAGNMAPIPDAPVQQAALNPAPSQPAAPPVPVGGTYVQAGAFSSQANAQALSAQLADLGPVEVTPVNVNGQVLYRVRVGPLSDPQLAGQTLQQVSGRGHSGARVIFE